MMTPLKLFVPHGTDGKICDWYTTYYAKDIHDAEIDFTGDHCATPEECGIKLVEYVPKDVP